MTNTPLRSTILHWRLPFGFFLLPIFLFAVVVSPPTDLWPLILAFVAIHLFLYPASHAFNSWYDKDEQSIGLLKTPPPVTRSLFLSAWILDALALTTAFFVSWLFGLCLTVYTLASKAYSWPPIRFKRLPISGWLGVGLIQGALTFFATAQGLGTPVAWTSGKLWLGVVIAAVFLWAVYPMTQIYQHEEDGLRGDQTISRKLGIRGTFVLSGLLMGLAGGLFFLWFFLYQGAGFAVLFLISEVPVAVYFTFWAMQCWKNPERANFRGTMVLNLLASGMTNLFFLWEILRIWRII